MGAVLESLATVSVEAGLEGAVDWVGALHEHVTVVGMEAMQVRAGIVGETIAAG